MSALYIRAMTPTFREAERIGLMAKRIHAQDIKKSVILGKVSENDPTWREPQWGKPRTRVYWAVGTQNPAFAMDSYAWNRAEYLHESKPYYLAYLISWIDMLRTIFHWSRPDIPPRFA